VAHDRASQLDQETVYEEIRKRLRDQPRNYGEFVRVHICPTSGADVPDERDARLVVLDPQHPHTGKDERSAGRKAAEKLLAERGTGPRLYRNTLIFLAPDKSRLAELEDAVRQFRAWDSIVAERETLELTPFQANQAKTKRDQMDQTVKLRIPETYTWLLVPMQGADPQSPLGWEEIKLTGSDDIIPRASRRLVSEEMLVPRYAGTLLRMRLDEIPLWRGDRVGVKQLADDFAQFLYLPRLKDSNVLVAAIRDGVNRITWEQETFAYADSYDPSREKYVGLRAGELADVIMDGQSVVVKPEVARDQISAETGPLPTGPAPSNGWAGVSDNGAAGREQGAGVIRDPGGASDTSVRVAQPPRRFVGSVKVDPRRLSSTAGTISQEVLQHLLALIGADVDVTIEIQATVPGGIPDHIVRTVTENCRTLGFNTPIFEEE
jgi:hypothetical protein